MNHWIFGCLLCAASIIGMRSAVAESDAGAATHRATFCSARDRTRLQGVEDNGRAFDIDLRGSDDAQPLGLELIIELDGRLPPGAMADVIEYRSNDAPWSSDFVVESACHDGRCPDANDTLVASVSRPARLSNHSPVRLRSQRPAEAPGIVQICLAAVLWGDAPNPDEPPDRASPDPLPADAGHQDGRVPPADARDAGAGDESPHPPGGYEGDGCAVSSGHAEPLWLGALLALFVVGRRRGRRLRGR